MEKFFAIGHFRQVLVQVVLFHLLRRCHAQNDAIPNFLPDSKSSFPGLSNELLFVSEFISEGKKDAKFLSENLGMQNLFGSV